MPGRRKIRQGEEDCALMNNELVNIISNFRSFDWTRDLLDVIIIAVAFYELILFARKSRADSLSRAYCCFWHFMQWRSTSACAP